MDRFASVTINNIDKKGRVSIPAPFRAVLGGEATLRGLMSVDHPVVEAGGNEMKQVLQRRLEQLDPFSEDYEVWSHYALGDVLDLKLDGEGRIQINDRIREQTGIGEQVLFEGRGISFWLWEPGRYDAYRTEARAKVRELRKRLGSRSSSGAPSGAGGGADR